jgi:HK97 family phage portal protein
MLNKLFRDETRAQATTWGVWQGESLQSYAGVPVSAETSLQLLAVQGCVRLIADGISTLPVDVFREVNNAPVEMSKPGWLNEPTVDLDFVAWCTQILSSLLLYGNAYLIVMRNSGGQIVEIPVLDPNRVRVVREGVRKAFWVNGARSTAEIVHIKGLMLPGYDVGMSPVEYARQSIGLGLSAVEYGAKFFDSDGNMPGVIQLPGPADQATMNQLAEQWKRKRNRRNKGLPGVLPSGATWMSTGVTNEQAQFLATRAFTQAEIAGQMFLVDPTDLGIEVGAKSMTYANLEQRQTRRVQVTFLPWIVRLERAITSLLPNPRYMKFNVNALLRGDMLTRYQAYQIGITSQFLESSEIREWEELGPMTAAPEAPEPSGGAPDGT